MSDVDPEQVAVAVALIGRTGAVELEFGYLDDDVPVADARWWAKARYGGQVVIVENERGPLEAVEGLAFKLIEGGRCTHCFRKVTRFGDRGDEHCRYQRQGDMWRRGCEDTHPADGPVPTTRKLATALQRAGCPRPMVEAALGGFYDDFKSPLALPTMQLVSDLRALGLEELAQRVVGGEFDSTKEESEAWAASEDGQAAFAELIGTRPNRKQRRAARRSK